ncbi:hypothetical protein Zmor_002505 [Zophobas morio]|uniref:Uncharacterized protein n=1 Tax=Zophobas morio TaxID=2755281 RepID=A0AA38J5I0_9CUCU|nr:hypothetical protein Zmor_002505 [Zophobas morio]
MARLGNVHVSYRSGQCVCEPPRWSSASEGDGSRRRPGNACTRCQLRVFASCVRPPSLQSNSFATCSVRTLQTLLSEDYKGSLIDFLLTYLGEDGGIGVIDCPSCIEHGNRFHLLFFDYKPTRFVFGGIDSHLPQRTEMDGSEWMAWRL